MTNTATNTRELILSILLEVNKEGEYSHIAIRNVLEKYQYLDAKDRSFIKIVSEGTLERQITIDYIISQFSKVPVKKMKPVIRELLRMSVYQMKYMDQVPVSAICNEAVKLAEKKGFRTLKGFVNGVLRNIARGLETIEPPNLSIRYSMPEWIVSLWTKEYGEEQAEKMLESSLQKSPTIIRCNHVKNEPKELQQILEQEGVTVLATPFFQDTFEIHDFDYLASLKSFQEGRFAVQDLSSVLVGVVAAPKAGQTVIDVCAAPGGKSFHIADLMKNTGVIKARDLTEYKTDLIEENKKRLGITCVEACVQDALVKLPEDKETADLVIADLPCSGLGVLRRKNDLKMKASAEKIAELAVLQQQILSNIAEMVKPGGILIYSTCTVTSQENLDNRAYILEHLPFEAVSMEEELPEELQGGTGREGYIQLLQGVHPCDGFFLSKYRKKG